MILEQKERNDSFLQLSLWHVSNAKNIKDYVKAYNYAKKAIKSGYIEGYYILGQLLILGTGCEKNMIKGLGYLQKFIAKVDTYNVDESTIADAYYKLAHGYFELGHYDKALTYYNKLKAIDLDLASKLDDLEFTVRSNIKDFKFNLVRYITLAVSFVLISYVLYKNFYNDVERFLFEPKAEAVSVVTNIDINSVTKNSEEIIIKDENDFYLLSEAAFNEYGLSLVEPISITASSEYKSLVGADFSPTCLIDGDINTYWQEGVSGAGIGENIHVMFPNIMNIRGLAITNGKALTENDYKNNNRLQTFIVKAFDEYNIRIEDKPEKQYILFNKNLELSSLDLIIDSIYRGQVFDDTCITDIEFYGNDIE